MRDDFRNAFRNLLRNRAFTAMTVLIMGFGIGAATAVFSVVNAILFRPLPGIADPARLVEMFRTQKREVFDNFSYPDYLDYRERSRSFSAIAAHSMASVSFNAGSAERLCADMVSDNYFDLLGVKPGIGRAPAAMDEVLISDALWQRDFAGNSNAIGRRVVVNAHPVTISGIAPKGFRGISVADSIDLWAPIDAVAWMNPGLSAGILADRSAGWIGMFGRLTAPFPQAQAEMSGIASQLSAADPVTNQDRGVGLARGIGMYPDDRAEIGGLFRLLSSSVGLLLLISCANVAGLMMIRASRREREIAVRLAIGAAPSRIVRQLFAEGLALAAIAGAFGLLIAQWTAAAVIQLSAPGVPLLRHADTGIDVRVLGFTLVTCVLTGVLFAIAPAAHSSRIDLVNGLRSGSGSAGYRHKRFRSILVAAQVTLCFLLLSASGALLRDLYLILIANPGFDARNVAMFSVDLSTQGYTPERRLAIGSEILDRLSGLPGVVSASLATTVPPDDLSGREPIFYPGQEPPPELLHGRSWAYGLWVDVDAISPHYFETLGIPILQGRDFSNRDRAGAPGVVIISRKLAERLWPGESAVGKRIAWPAWNGPPRPPFEVIGVAADAKYRSLTSEQPLLMYIPSFWAGINRTQVVLRTAADPALGLGDAARAIRAVDKDLTVFNPKIMHQHVAESLWQQRMAALWIGAFSLFALVLAAVGLYALIAQSVAQRTREVGIRMALGASPGTVEREVIREGLALASIGFGMGMFAWLALEPLLGRWVTHSEDHRIVVFVAGLLFFVMLAACWLPARRAAKIDPVAALRCD